MKQVFQDVASGQSEVLAVPRPACKRGYVVIESAVSLISAGTERMLVDFSRAGYVAKARQQPEKVKMVVDKIRTDGLLSTIETVRAKLDEPMPMGYSNVGRVIEVGAGVREFSVGDRVLSNGQHAEIVCIGKNLCAKVPDNVSDEDAVFGVVGSIALQGIRLAAPTTGECFVVVGLGLIGLMAVQILRASGCRVLGTDFDESKLELARAYGAETVNPGTCENLMGVTDTFSRGRGVDGVIITASTSSNDPIRQSAQMCRKRGRIVLVGVVGLDINRADFYEKELTFQVSCSYGPGRYDEEYEQRGSDYPVGFVRWTEQRNFEAVLDLLAARQLSVDALKTATFAIDNAADAYELLVKDRSALGVLIEYPVESAAKHDRRQELVDQPSEGFGPSSCTLGAIGSGNYAGRVLLPAFKQANAGLHTIVSSRGVTGSHVGRKLGFSASSTDTDDVLKSGEIDTVVIATQHDSHASLTIAALKAGKHVFVEKPLALSSSELADIEGAYQEARDRGDDRILMVGFNRRFAPLMQKLKAAVDRSAEPVSIVYTCNAGSIDADSWVQDPERGGGRIIGEACHFIDAARFLAGSEIQQVHVANMHKADSAADCRDTASISLQFANGSIAAIHYFANGHRSFPKERIEVFQGEAVYVLDNFRALKNFGGVSIAAKSRRLDKGQNACCEAFVKAVRAGGPSPIPFSELLEVSRVTINAAMPT